MPNRPNPDTVALHVWVPKPLKQAIEMQAVANKYQPNSGPSTLTDLVITALEHYLEDRADIRAAPGRPCGRWRINPCGQRPER
ncbi:MAG TPA: hypothetical protein VKY74_08200 [Chloroflexia bacterium]|nr:hypothetical protein [Chloroflexia bacterium]